MHNMQIIALIKKCMQIIAFIKSGTHSKWEMRLSLGTFFSLQHEVIVAD